MSGAPRQALEEVVSAVDPRLRPYARELATPDGLDLDVPDRGRAFTLAAVREGYLLHYEQAHAFEDMDDDLHLLGGDALYALGLERLAEVGDLEAIAELADLISLCAWAHAERRPEAAPELWKASVAALSGRGGGARTAIPL